MKKKISQYLFGFILCAIIMIISPIYAQAGQAYDDYNAYSSGTSGNGIAFSNGEIIIVSQGKAATSGYRYRSIGWNIDVNQDGVSHNIYIDDSEGSRYEETVDGQVYTSTHFSEALISGRSEFNLRQGKIVMIANARMQAYNASTGEVYSTSNSWSDWEAQTGWQNEAIRNVLIERDLIGEFYNKVINWSTYYLNVKKGTGVSSTYGSGWYNSGTSVSYGGTADTGYHSATSDTITVNSNKEVTVTASPNILTINFDGNGGSNVPSTQYMAYNSSYNLSNVTPSRPGGYSFVGWTQNTAWSDTDTKWTSNDSNKALAQTWASRFGKDLGADNQSVTLYAQWVKTVTHTFYYFNNQHKQASVTFHNGETSKTMTVPSGVLNSATYGGYTWSCRGLSSSSGANASASKVNSLSISSSASNKTYYVSYSRTVTIKYVDYSDNRQNTYTQTGTAYLNYNARVISPTFTSRTQNTMQYTEKSVNGSDKKETWTARGWTTSTAQNATYPILNQNTNFSTFYDTTYYGLYYKKVTLIYNPNGGTVSPTCHSYIRYANAVDVSKATKTTYTMPTPTWVENGVTKYSFGAWTYGGNDDLNASGYTPNSNFYGKIVGTNNGYGQFKYTPLVNDTVYAAWTNKSSPTPYEPNVTVTKEAAWNNPSGDNSAVDFDAKQNIDIDGIARVTVKVNITNQNGIGAKDIKVTDYFNTDMWDYYQDSKIRPNVSRGSMSQSGNTITWNIPNNATGTVTLTYYVKIKEPYWNVDNDKNDYINKIPDLDKYLSSLTDSSKNPGTAKIDNFYYCSSAEASRAYVWVSYNINSGKLVNTNRMVHNATPYVVMRQVNWIPTVANQGIGIESDTNNIYHNIDSSYKNTYFVRYDTKGADSKFRLYELSQLKRSYSYYQITNNLMDMQSVNKTQEVIDNALNISTKENDKSSTWTNVTSSKLSSGFRALDLLKVSSANNVRGSVTTAGVIYRFGSLTSYDTDYATNQDGLKLSVYPFVRTTNSKQNKTFETTRDTTKLANKRLDLTIDATDPIITADSNIKTKSSTYGDWTESDGYIDINLVNKSTNPIAATKNLTFKFKDEVSGINSPLATNEDWINTSRDNVQVTLKRVDNEPITIFDSNDTTSNDNKYIKVTYDSTNTMNKTGNVKLTLDPNDKNILGHLKLTIRVYDNVGNWTEKTYDIYSFCLTGAVEISDTLPDYSTRQYSLSEINNGELGIVKVRAAGYADRVTVNFDTYLDKLYKDEYSKRQNFANDNVTTINGDYPSTDVQGVSGSGIDSSMTYLPYAWQVNTWGYTSDTLGGVRLQDSEAKKYQITVDNTILRAHLNDLIERYQGIKNGTSYSVEKGTNYAIVDSTLYTYPAMNGNNVTSYVNRYELGGETYYDDILYPAYITLDGTTGIDIIYSTAEGQSKMAPSVEATTTVSVSNWTAVGNSYLRPFMHYFYMPMEAKIKTASDPYYVTLTEYKDSEKSFKHSVSIRLSFTNDNGSPISKDLETYIKDN